MTENTLSKILIASLLSGSSCFNTESCTHEQLQWRQAGFARCMAEESHQNTGHTTVDLCTPFTMLEGCIKQEWSGCMSSAAVHKVVVKNQALLRREFEEAMASQQEQYGGWNSHSTLLDSCPTQLPSHQEASQADEELLFWMEQVETDRGCNMTTRIMTNQHLGSCLATERTRLDELLRQRLLDESRDFHADICPLLHETMGTCLGHSLPSCFSEREIEIIQESIKESFKILFDFLGKHLGPNYQFSVSRCSVWEEQGLLTFISSGCSPRVLSLFLLLSFIPLFTFLK